MPDEFEAISDAFNRVFALELKWLTNSAENEVVVIKRSELQEMHRLCEFLARQLEDRRVQTAIWTLTQTKGLISAVLIDPKLMLSIDLSGNERNKIAQSCSRKAVGGIYFVEKDDIFKRLRQCDKSKIIDPIYASFRDPTANEYDKIIFDFYKAEEKVLHKSGLNQNSIAIIIQRLKDFESAIKTNLARRSSVLLDRYKRALTSLKTFSYTTVTIADRAKVGAGGYIKLRNVKSLGRSRDKLIGLATLWGDAVPLIVAQDWGIAGVVSTTAGATVASILPANPSNT